MQHSIDGEGRLREVNPFWLETLGYRREDVIGHGLWEFMTEDSARYMRESGLPRCLRAGEARNFAYRLVKKDGETIDVLHFAVEHRDAMGKFDHSLGFLIDVSEPKRAEDPLRESDARLAEATRIAGLGYAIWDAAADKCTYCSEAFARIHGLTPEAYIARASSLDGAFALTHPDDRESVRAAMKALGDGKGFEMEYRVITPDGETRHVHEIARPIFDAQGAVVQEYEVIQDITERNQAEEALRASEARLTQAQRIAKISHWVWDELEDRQTYTSDEADRIWGTPSGTLFAGFDSFLDTVHPDDRDHVDSVMEQAKQDRTGYEVEYRTIRPDGKQLHILEQADVELDERGILLRTIGTIQDITERKQAEESLRASEARYREIFAESPVGIWVEDWSEVKELIDRLAAEGVTDWRGYFTNEPGAFEAFYSRIKLKNVSRAILELYGVSHAHALEDLFRGKMETPEELIGELELLLRFIDGKTAHEYEARETTADGHQVVTRSRVAIPPSGRDDWSSVIYAIEDITERKRAEEALRASEARYRALIEHSLPIRLTPMTATCRVPPLSRVKLGIGWSRGVARDAEQ